jgi:hypothetical protein
MVEAGGETGGGKAVGSAPHAPETSASSSKTTARPIPYFFPFRGWIRQSLFFLMALKLAINPALFGRVEYAFAFPKFT